MQTKHRDPLGFTLIELLVVIAIIAILAAILFPVFAQAREKARAIDCLSNKKQIGLGMMQYVQDYDETYPANNWAYGKSWDAVQGGWMQEIQPYLKNLAVYQCPDAVKSTSFATIPGPGGSVAGTIHVPYFQIGANEYVVSSITPTISYVGWKGNITEAQIGKPADLPVIADSLFMTFDDAARIINANYNGANWWAYSAPVDPSLARHSGGESIVYADGHAKWISQGAMAWQPSLKYPNGSPCGNVPQTNTPYCWGIPIDPKTDPRLQ